MVIKSMKQLPDPGLNRWTNKSHEPAIPYIFTAGDAKQIASTYIYRLPYVEKVIATKAVREWCEALQSGSGTPCRSDTPNGSFVRSGAMPAIEEWMGSARDYEVTVVRKMLSYITHESRKRRESERQPEGNAGSLFQHEHIIGTRPDRTSRPQTAASLSCGDVEQPPVQIVEECSGEQETFRSETTEETAFVDEELEPTPRQATPISTPQRRATPMRTTPVRATAVTVMSPEVVQRQPPTPPLTTKEFERQYVATPASAQRQTSSAQKKSNGLLSKRSKEPRSTSLDNSKPHLVNRPPSSRVVPSQGPYSINYENRSGLFHRVAPKGSIRQPDSFMTWTSNRDNFAIENYVTDSLDGDRRLKPSHRTKQKTSAIEDLNRLINRKRGGEQRSGSGTQQPTSRAGEQRPNLSGKHQQRIASSVKSVTPHARFEPTPPRSPSLTDVHHPSNGEVEVTKYRNKKVITIEKPRHTTADAVRSRQKPIVNVDMSYAL